MNKERSAISRREFARRAALASASLVSPTVLPLPTAAGAPPSLPAQSHPQLSAASQAEAEARFQAIVAAYPDRFSEDQKKELRRLSLAAQPSLDRLRAHALENGDAPALYLKPLVEREKKPEPKPTSTAANPTAKKP